MANKLTVIVNKKMLAENKIASAKRLNKSEQISIASKQEIKLKITKPAVQEFVEWV